MGIKGFKMGYEVTHEVSYINLTDEILLVEVIVKHNDKVYKTDYFPCHIDNIGNLSEIDYNPNSVQKKFIYFAIMRKEFTTAYANGKNFFDYFDNCEEFDIEYKDAFIGLTNGNISLDDIVLVERNGYNNTLYPFVYGKTKVGWFPHMVHYSDACYMCTDADYDLPELARFLHELEKEGKIRIYHGDTFKDDENIIQNIPAYDRYGDKRTQYINFDFLAEESIDDSKINCDGYEPYYTMLQKFWK